MRKILILMVVAVGVMGSAANAACTDEISVGSTLLARKTITGSIENGKEKDGFEGCSYNRVLVFEDRTGVQCMSYNYEYAYRPTAEIWNTPAGLMVCVENTMMAVMQIR